MVLAALTFFSAQVAWAALAAAVVLLPLAWWALRPAETGRATAAVGLALRTLAIGLVLLALLDPRWSSERPARGANVVAVLADNSQGLQIAESPAEPSRGDQLRSLVADSGRWTALEAEYQVRRYTFGTQLRRVPDFAGLGFDESGTHLAAALADLRLRLARQPAAGVVLFTDGNATDLGDTLPDLSGLPPIYPVVVGEGTGLRDLGISTVATRVTAFDDAPVTLQAQLHRHNTPEAAQAVVRRLFPAPAPGDPAELRQAVRFGRARSEATAEFQWRPDHAGLSLHEVVVQTDADEATLANNRRLVVTDRGPAEYRILYVGGRINWEFKFLNRALADDPQLKLVGLLRLARREPKFDFRGRGGEAANPLFRGFRGNDDTTHYDQPVLTRVNTRDEAELRGGFPRTAAELFAYDAVILDDVEAEFFSPEQLLLLRQFVSDRGGGLLMLGGVDTLEHGGYQNTVLAAALPVHLPSGADAASPSGELAWKLTREGWLEPWTRIRAGESDERVRIDQMPRFLVANARASSKPGATVLAVLEDETGETYPGLVAQNFGRGRSASIGAGDLWRWGLKGPSEQADLARFWRQVSRWLVTNVPAPVELRSTIAAGGDVEFRIQARDEEYRALETSQLELRLRPLVESETDGGMLAVTLRPEPHPEQPGTYVARFTPTAAGAYHAEAEVRHPDGRLVGRAETAWVHDPAAAEFNALTPNRALLETIARQTGGQVLEVDELANLPRRFAQRPAPVMETVSTPLWHNAWIFSAILLTLAAEWAWRRWKGLA